MSLCILLELGKDRRSLQFFTWAGAFRIDRFPPPRRIFFVDELGDGNFGKVRIAEKLRPVEERASVSLDGEMNRVSRPALHFREIVAFQNIERLDEHRA